MKIAFLHDWQPDYEQEITWQDGLSAALKVLKERHGVKLFTVGPDTVIPNPLHKIHQSSNPVTAIAEYDPDVILIWGDMTRPHTRPLFDLGKPLAICFAGGDVTGENLPFYSHIFVESSVYKDKLDGKTDAPVTIAFGTNTSLFKPFEPELPKTWDTIFPATFALWKRHWLYAQATQKMRSLACGFVYYDHETECWQECVNRGITVMPHVSAETLHYQYGQSQVGVITSDSSGGSQRTVLEMMAMNLPVVITDSDKFDDYIANQPSVIRADPTPEAVREAIQQAVQVRSINTRAHVLRNWSEHTYAKALEKGLQALV